jgi:hypothetical protein
MVMAFCFVLFAVSVFDYNKLNLALYLSNFNFLWIVQRMFVKDKREMDNKKSGNFYHSI